MVSKRLRSTNRILEDLDSSDLIRIRGKRLIVANSKGVMIIRQRGKKLYQDF